MVLELKATNFFIEADHKQIINCVKATKFKLGLLINFGTPSLTYKRIVN
ncbi:MAG: GxxExxY protein [Draconibacterium sp.]